VSLLAEILAAKQIEISRLRERPRKPSGHTPIDVLPVLRRSPGGVLRLIAEVKLRSPSAGPLSRTLSPEDRACAYAEAGASMVSVLCDGPYFDGSFDHVTATMRRLGAIAKQVPVLAKEYVIDPRQVAEASDRGADAVLLIARIGDARTLSTLVRCARDEGIEPLVEVMDERELEWALASGARMVGVNSRDLDTLKMDSARAARVLAAIPTDVVAVYMSGVRDPDGVRALAAGRADAALVGEVLMREDDPRRMLGELVGAARTGGDVGK
jgi:indole-3-glycerol phosphate synthase